MYSSRWDTPHTMEEYSAFGGHQILAWCIYGGEINQLQKIKGLNSSYSMRFLEKLESETVWNGACQGLEERGERKLKQAPGFSLRKLTKLWTWTVVIKMKRFFKDSLSLCG